MKRWKLTYIDNTQRLYYSNSCEELSKRKDIKSIEPYTDDTYMSYIEKIKSHCTLLKQQVHNDSIREYYSCDYNKGNLVIRLSKDISDNIYYDLAAYQEHKTSSFIYPITFTLSTPKKVYELINIPSLEYIVYSHRYYGQPKLSKPKELKNINSIGSATFISKKCSPQIYIKDNDIYIKHTDYFSSLWRPPKGEIGNEQSYYLNKYFNINSSKKFIYGDNFASIVLRNEAWILLKNSVQIIKSTDNYLIFVKLVISQQKLDKYSYLNTEDMLTQWENFYMNVYSLVKDYLKKEM